MLVHLRKPRLYRLVLRIMQLTCSTDSVIQFLERLYPPLQVKLIVRGAEERGGGRERERKEEKGASLAAVDGERNSRMFSRGI